MGEVAGLRMTVGYPQESEEERESRRILQRVRLDSAVNLHERLDAAPTEPPRDEPNDEVNTFGTLFGAAVAILLVLSVVYYLSTLLVD